MKIILACIFLFINLAAFSQSPLYKSHHILLVDLNRDSIADTIFIMPDIHDRSTFKKITISITGYGRQTFLARNSWTNVDSAFLNRNINAVRTKKLFLAGNNNQSVILLFGELDGAGYRDEFSIINIENNKAKMVFDHTDDDIDVEIPTKLADLDNDGKLDFIFTEIGEVYEQVDSLKGSIGSYHPYFIYTVDDNCRLNKVLTKKYNDEHYVFAGYEYSEDIKILYPRNGGKPKVLK
ncbi:MAG TPA: hypothetical protein VGM41_18695 [Chitinophagaceae bacterium]